MSTILIFPSSTVEARKYYALAKERGDDVVAASSLLYDETSHAYENYIRLPSIRDPLFADHFLKAVNDFQIDRIFSTASIVRAFLDRLIAEHGLKIRHVTEPPVSLQMRAYRELLARADDAARFINVLSDGKFIPSRLHIAAVMRHAADIYGESNESKLLAVMGIFPSAPKGDVVEIGALMGKSAFVLSFMADYHATGPMLVVDPWSSAALPFRGVPPFFSDLNREWDWDLAAEAFLINMLPTVSGNFGYLRMRSEDGYRKYQTEKSVTTEYFGTTKYSGRIAMIHIDGNHGYEFVKKDCCLWFSNLVPGAWAIIDDYVWAYGDGPERVGNVVLEQRRDDIDRAFVCGKALFIKFR